MTKLPKKIGVKKAYPKYSEWQSGTRQIQNSLAQSCADMVDASVYGYVGLSLWGNVTKLNPTADDLKNDKDIKMVSFHKYVFNFVNTCIF